MSIDTEIKGDPASVTATAGWLSGSLRASVTASSNAFAAASRSPGWEGETAASFGTWASGAASLTDEVEAAITSAARAMTTFAADLRKAQREMEEICSDAREAELDVAGHVIADPGAGPGKPAPLPRGGSGLKISGASVAAHAGAMAAFELHRKKVEAYRKAEQAATEVRAEYDGAGAEVGDQYTGLQGAGWFFAGVDLAVGAVAGYGGWKADQMRKRLAARRDATRSGIKAAGYDASDVQHRQVELDKRRVAQTDARIKGIGRNALRGAGALNAVSSIYDITQGKDPREAIAAGAGGFAGGVLGGAAIGSFAGPPGALIGGAIGGIIGSGTAEGLVKDGLGGLDNGVEALVDTGGALVGAAGKGAEKVGGVVEDVGGALNPFD